MLQSGHRNETEPLDWAQAGSSHVKKNIERFKMFPSVYRAILKRKKIHAKRHPVMGKNLGENNRKTPPLENREFGTKGKCAKRSSVRREHSVWRAADCRRHLSCLSLASMLGFLCVWGLCVPVFGCRLMWKDVWMCPVYMWPHLVDVRDLPQSSSTFSLR